MAEMSGSRAMLESLQSDGVEADAPAEPDATRPRVAGIGIDGPTTAAGVKAMR